MEALLIVILGIIGLVVGAFVVYVLFMSSAYLLMAGLILAGYFAPMIVGIIFGVYVSNAGNVSLGVFIMVVSIIIGIFWIRLFDKHVGKKL